MKPIVLAGLLLLAGPAFPAPRQGDDRPRDSGIVERAERRLAQLDVTVTGPLPDVAELTERDFELVVFSRPVPEFTVDRVCRVSDLEREAAAAEAPPDETPSAAPAPALVSTRTMPATVLFYFDQQHLTSYGRQQALDIARALVPQLVAGGNRATIVSSAGELKTIVDLTEDVDVLLDGLERLERDRTQWDTYAQFEQDRVNELHEMLHTTADRRTGVDRAKAVARRNQREEQFRTAGALRRFSTTLTRLADLDPPKLAVYFADTMRANAGAHYMSFFTRRDSGIDPVLDAMAIDNVAARNPFDRVLDEAAAHGVRVYTVQAEGLVAGGSVSSVGSGRSFSGSLSSGTNTQRVRDAQDALGSLAVETGARAFLNGVDAKEIAETIERDLACLYLVSFDAREFPEDETLPVRLKVLRPGVRAQVRGQIRLMSDSERDRSRLLAAFTAPGSIRSDLALSGRVVPAGFEKGRYVALLQISIPGSEVQGASWDVGASIVAGGRVRDETSGQITVDAPRVGIVYESELRFPPGPYEITMVAREASTGEIAVGRVAGEWPDPDQEAVTVGPVAVVQPVDAVFVRDGESRSSGGLALGDSTPLQPDVPTALVGIVCRGHSRAKRLQLERSLVGESAAPFPLMELEFEGEQCAQFRDVVPARTMTEGRFVYEVHVRKEKDKDELAAREVAFVVVE